MTIAALDNRLSQMANELDLIAIGLPDSELKLKIKDAQIAILEASVELAIQVRNALSIHSTQVIKLTGSFQQTN